MTRFPKVVATAAAKACATLIPLSLIGLIPRGIMNGIAGNATDEPILDTSLRTPLPRLPILESARRVLHLD